VSVVRYLLVVLALAGAVVSGMALRVHYSDKTESCSINETWDCGRVNHSSFAEIAHFPVAAIGIAGYLVLAVLPLLRMRFVLFLAANVGFMFALRLSLIEEYALGAWCVYCVISQVIIGLILLISLGWHAAEYRALRKAAPSI